MESSSLLDGFQIEEMGAVLQERVILEQHEFVVERPRDADRLRGNAALRALVADEDYAPYWSELWPASRMLAKAILREPWAAGTAAIEIGCGLGLPGIAALAAGLQVTFSDYDPVALRFAARNAQINGFSGFRVLRLDWRSPPTGLHFPVVLASDLIYELKNVEPLVRLIEQLVEPGGLCLVTDQDRIPSHALRDELARRGLSFSTERMRAGEPGGRRTKGTLYRITGPS